MKRLLRLLRLLLLVSTLLVACGGEDAMRPPPPPPPPPIAIVDASAPVGDPLGPRPVPAESPVFTPPIPTAYKRDGGLNVWLVERHALPIVSIQIVVPAGAAHDPPNKGGLAVTTANMLDEGAGKRGALEISRDIDRLGAKLVTGAVSDYAFIRLTVLKKNLAAAAAIFGDVVSKPQMSPVEYKRVHDLWENALKQRQSEPDDVANVVITRKGYPVGHPYAHPSDGTLVSAAQVKLEDVKKLYGERYRPDLATCVVVGDVTKGELDSVLDQALGSWKAPPTAAPPVEPTLVVPSSSVGHPAISGRRVFVVDRADAPQSVIAVARPGTSAFDADSAALVRVNAALGGSFTSRLNQDLREEHGWSYGARSRFSFSRMKGIFVASAAVHTEHTGDALKAMIADIESMHEGGLTDEEVEKTRKLAMADLVEEFEGAEAAARRLGRNAGIGLGPDHDATASKVTARADKATLQKLTSAYLDIGTSASSPSSVIVIVGPRAKIEPQLKAIGIGSIESTGPEGQ